MSARPTRSSKRVSQKRSQPPGGGLRPPRGSALKRTRRSVSSHPPAAAPASSVASAVQAASAAGPDGAPPPAPTPIRPTKLPMTLFDDSNAEPSRAAEPSNEQQEVSAHELTAATLMASHFWEQVVLPHIFGFLKTTEKLRMMARVSRTWRSAAWNPLSHKLFILERPLLTLSPHKVVRAKRFMQYTTVIDLFEAHITAEGISEWVRHCGANLKSVRLAGCIQTSNLTLQVLGQHCPRLESLDLTCCCRVTEPGIRAVALGCPNLKSLTLWGCKNIINEALVELGRGGRKLQSLDLTWLSRVSERGLRALATGSPDLRRLILMWCEHVRDSGFRALTLRNLRVLNADGCTRISDIGLTALAKNCPNLRVLSLRFMTKITVDGVAVIVHGCQRLLLLDVRDCDYILYKHAQRLSGMRSHLTVLPNQPKVYRMG